MSKIQRRSQGNPTVIVTDIQLVQIEAHLTEKMLEYVPKDRKLYKA